MDAVLSWILLVSQILKIPRAKAEVHLLNLIQYRRFRGCSWMEGGRKGPRPPKIYHTYPTMMKHGTIIPYLKIKKNI